MYNGFTLNLQILDFMHRLIRTTLYVIFFLLLFSSTLLLGFSSAWAASSPTPSIKEIILLVKKGNYTKAIAEATRTNDPALILYAKWGAYIAPFPQQGYPDILHFIQSHPEFPDTGLLAQRAEETLSFTLPPATILNYFKKTPPLTGRGKWLLAQAKYSSQPLSKELLAELREGWVQGNFLSSEVKYLVTTYSKIFSPETFYARADRLIWEDRFSEAVALFPYITQDKKILCQARIKLLENKPGVDKLIKVIPAKLQKDLGLLYARIRWQAKRENYDSVLLLLDQLSAKVPYPEKWWDIRNRLLRELLTSRHYTAAYKVAKAHGIASTHSAYSEAEWLSGWIALQFLKKPKTAYRHFYAMAKNVNFPISKSRGSYWAGRAAEANGNITIAHNWYNIAAQYPTTFYGQLAHEKMLRHEALQLPVFPTITQEDITRYKKNSLAKIANYLAKAGEKELARKFMNAAVDYASTPGEVALLSEMGKKNNATFLTVNATKTAEQQGIMLIQNAFPILDNLPKVAVEKPLVHAIIRQESRFDPTAKSAVGAEGLMQLLPSTARHTAHLANIRYHRSRLTQSPMYNVQIGSHYLNQLIKQFNGSYLLAIAAYNAGPANVKKWIKLYGDPREMTDGRRVVDWIELIPFSETRNYVQRVVENLHIYRHLLVAKKEKKYVISNDYVNGSL